MRTLKHLPVNEWPEARPRGFLRRLRFPGTCSTRPPDPVLTSQTVPGKRSSLVIGVGLASSRRTIRTTSRTHRPSE